MRQPGCRSAARAGDVNGSIAEDGVALKAKEAEESFAPLKAEGYSTRCHSKGKAGV